MKRLLLLLFLSTLLFSCYKEPVEPEIKSTEPSGYFGKPATINSSNDDEDENDDDDEDEDEDDCCRFRYGQWQPCSAGYQVRSWNASSKSCQPPLDSIQRTCDIGIVTYLYYNPQYTSLRIACTTNGTLNIFNSDGQLTASLQYQSGARWVNVSFLPLGNYTVSTFDRTVRFTR